MAWAANLDADEYSFDNPATVASACRSLLVLRKPLQHRPFQPPEAVVEFTRGEIQPRINSARKTMRAQETLGAIAMTTNLRHWCATASHAAVVVIVVLVDIEAPPSATPLLPKIRLVH